MNRLYKRAAGAAIGFSLTLGAFMNISAAGYDVVLSPDISYTTESSHIDDGQYGETITKYSNLMSNFSHGYSIVYENCEKTDNGFVITNYSESQRIINDKGETVDIGDYDSIGTGYGNIYTNDKFYVTYSDMPRNGIDAFGGVCVSKADKYGYVGLADNVVIPCKYEDVVTRFGDNVFSVGFYAERYFIDRDGNRLSDYDETDEKSAYSETENINFGEYNILSGVDGLFAHCGENGKYGILDRNKNIIVPYVYDELCGVQSGYCWAAKDGKWSLLKISLSDIKVTAGGKDVEFDQIPLVINGRTLAPLRAVFESLGATVDWNGETQTVTSTKGTAEIKLTIGSNEMYKNGNAIPLEEAPRIIGGRTLVPVRAIAEAFDCKVDWNGETQTVAIIE